MKRWSHYVAWALNRPILRDVLPAQWYLQMKYHDRFGKFINMKDPKSFNEKLQWLKIHNRKKEYCGMVDKYEVRSYIAKKIGSEHLIPLVGGPWKSFDEIDFDTLPDQFVLKCTHDSGSVVICKDKNSFDRAEARQRLDIALNYNMYWFGREWPYKAVRPQIIAEKYMVDESGYELKDYKLFCFDGKVQFLKIDFGRMESHRANYYKVDGSMLPFGETVCPPDYQRALKMPDNLQKMVEFAELLSSGEPFMRVDFYSIHEEVYFGELTFFPGSGFVAFEPDEWNERVGDMLTLPMKGK